MNASINIVLGQRNTIWTYIKFKIKALEECLHNVVQNVLTKGALKAV